MTKCPNGVWRAFESISRDIVQIGYCFLKSRALVPSQGRSFSGQDVLQTYRLNIEPGWFAVRLSTKDANTFQGRHAPEGDILIIISAMSLIVLHPKNMISQKKRLRFHQVQC
jgi:hypothetical protein